ncbi:cytochrome c peroxidase [Spirosoma migulaei]
MKKLLVFIASISLLFQNCAKTDEALAPALTAGPTLPGTSYNYLVPFPAHIQTALAATDNTPANNPITNDGATLGRVLFYDRNLSLNRTVSCGSCHKQALSFDDNVALSRGFNNALTTRNSMSLLNVRFYRSGKMFWDERSATVEKQALQPIQNHLEMGLTLAELESRVNGLSYYPALFQKAFGSTTIDSVKIARALAQFERSIVTYQSKYDRVKQGTDSFTSLEAQGEQLFLTAPRGGGGGPAPACAGCHTPPMFITSTPAGPFAFPLESGINGQNRFKSGSLRNISTRKFLFHSGNVADVSAMLKAGSPGSGSAGIPAHAVSPADVAALLAFFTTLTDESITTDPKFSDPFKQ